ncbi:MAG: hypothetical protein ABFD18_14675 [Syntrophomonas sp.]
MPNLYRSNKFIKELKKLLKKGILSIDQVEKFLRLIEDNPQHSSLRTKKIQGTDGIYEASINMVIRVTFHYEKPNTIYLRNVGEHSILKDE